MKDVHLKGQIIETARAFSEKERRIAEVLKSEGKRVEALAEAGGAGRFADAEVDGIEIEFKTLETGATNSTIKNVISDSVRRGGQARHIIFDARESNLTKAETERGLARSGGITRGRVDGVRVIGDDFDLTATDFK